MSPPLRILRIVTRLNVGGPTRHVELLDRELRQAGHRTLLVHGPARMDEGPGVLSYGGPRLELPSLCRGFRLLQDLRALRALDAILREERPDVVHTHQSKAGALGRIAARRAGIPAIVHTFHGHVFEGYFPPLVSRILVALERRLAASAGALVAQSPGQFRDLGDRLGPKARSRLHCIAPAIPEAAFEDPPPGSAARLRRELEIPGSAPYLLLPARLVRIKRPRFALEVLAASAIPDLHLVILGDGPLGGAVESIARRRGLSERLRIRPAVAEPWAHYRHAHTVILPSRSEGTPLVLLEALAQGARVVASDVGGVADILGPFGQTLPWNAQASAWALAISNPAVAIPGPLDRDRMRRLHAPARLASELLDLYRHLIGGEAGLGSREAGVRPAARGGPSNPGAGSR